MKMQFNKHFLISVLVFFLFACSHSDEIKEEIKLLNVEFGDELILFANDFNFVQGQQMKWISKGKEIIFTEHGRVIATQEFSNGNLIFSYSNQKDPLSLNLLKLGKFAPQERLVDWSAEQSGITVTSTLVQIGEEEVEVPGKTFSVDCVLYHEKSSVPSLNISFTNKFWVDENTGELVKSEQLFNPNQPSLTLFHLID